ncbi:MAG: M1 family aminopeptidase [Armatimonadota bacterium]|nr:M1 family aminopeptidase [Armatimonadota bacterium]MDR7559576.1 M1 family aminopeptidase [Armatimonadota bacterium]MDR7573877.1 M1 family aminopeptidase [Armatimonadota bacterium]
MGRIARAGVTVAVLGLAVTVVRPAAWSQPTLDDLVIRFFEITASIAPVPLRYEVTEGGEPRFLSRGTLRGAATAMVEVAAPGEVGAGRFYFDSDMKLTSVRAPGYQVRPSRQRDILTLTFEPALPPGAKVPVTFEFEGRPLYLYDEFVEISEGTLYPVLVSPFGDFSANLGRVVLTLTVPAGYTVGATGRLVSRSGNTTTWDSEVAVPWVAIAGGRRHTIRERTVQGVAMQFYVPPGEDRNLDKLAGFLGRSVEFYSGLLYPFPYTELRTISSLRISGGIGYPAFLLIDDRAFKNTFSGTLNRDSFLLLLMAHEAAHSYVPSQTVPKGVGFIWLSEGFAEYLALMAVEALMGPEAFRRELQEERDNYARIAGSATEPAIASITFANYRGAARPVIYSKGALVLHMLRGLMGEDAFRQGLAAYFRAFRRRAARISDFQEAMERAAGQPLDAFFRQWIQEKVLPDYTVGEVRSAPAADGGTTTTAVVRNLGTGRMTVEVGFVMDGETHVEKADVPAKGEVTVTASTPKPVRRVEVDPRKWMIQKDYKNDTAAVR